MNEHQPISAPKPASRWPALFTRLVPQFVGLVFIWAGIVKLMQRGGLRAVLRFDAVPVAWIEPLTWIIIVVELGLGLALLILPRRREVLAAAIGLLILYTAQLVFLVFTHGAPSCGCMQLVEAFQDARRYNALSLARNVCLLLSLLLVWLMAPAPAARQWPNPPP